MIIIKNAIQNIKSNKIRVIAAIIWIILGITSVIVVSNIGNGIEKKSLDTKKNIQFRKIDMVFYPNYDSPISNPDFYEPFTQEDLNLISSMKEIDMVTPKYGKSTGSLYSGELTVENNSEFAKLTQYKDDLNLNLSYGRKFSLEDLDRKTIILDYDTALSLFNNDTKGAIGKAIDLNGEKFEVIGVLKAVELNPQDEENYREIEAYLPKKALEDLGNTSFSSSTITGLSIIISPYYETYEVRTILNKFFEKNKDLSYGSYGMEDEGNVEMDIEKLQYTINTFTGILSKVSLFIGGVGIMNIMYMAVSERRREIGIRRAIGAHPSDILIQFLIETMVITLIGGIIGMIVGTFVANYASDYIGIKAIASMKTYLKAFVVSMLTGAIFGVIPAIKASKLDPIKAIQG